MLNKKQKMKKHQGTAQTPTVPVFPYAARNKKRYKIVTERGRSLRELYKKMSGNWTKERVKKWILKIIEPHKKDMSRAYCDNCGECLKENENRLTFDQTAKYPSYCICNKCNNEL